MGCKLKRNTNPHKNRKTHQFEPENKPAIALKNITAQIMGVVIGFFLASLTCYLSRYYNFYFFAGWFVVFSFACYVKLDSEQYLKKRFKFLRFIR